MDLEFYRETGQPEIYYLKENVKSSVREENSLPTSLSLSSHSGK